MHTLRAIVGGRIFVPSGVLSRDAERELRERLTFWVSRWQRNNDRPKRVDGIVDVSAGFFLPRGAGHVLEALAEQDDLRVEFADRTSLGCPLKVQYCAPKGGRLHKHQKRAVKAFVRHRNGLAVFPCGGGKTTAGLATIAMLARSALILVHTHDLLDQWRGEIKAQLGIDATEAGIGLEAGPVTLAMVQGLTNRSHSQLERWSRNFGVCLLDECHHAPAETFRAVLGHMLARYRIGLTATPERTDGLGALMRSVIGPLLYEATVQDLVDAGRLVIPAITRLDTWQRYTEARDYRQLLNAIGEDEQRSRAIVARVAGHVRRGRQVIMLTLRVQHCEALAEMAREWGLKVGVLHGSVAKKKRSQILDKFRAGASRVLIATKVADEGLDAPKADVLVLTMPSRAPGAAAQRTGRVIRAVAGKNAIVEDVVDAHRIARQHWYRRKREYRDRYGEDSLRAPESLLKRELVELDNGS